MNKMRLECLREDIRQRINPSMERSEVKAFTDWVINHATTAIVTPRGLFSMYAEFREEEYADHSLYHLKIEEEV